MIMIACPGRDQLELLLNNRLVHSESAEVELHVEGCQACQRMLDALTDAIAWGLETSHRGSITVNGTGVADGVMADPLEVRAGLTAVIV